MTALTLQENTFLAWQERGDSAAADLKHAEVAPALFKPEFIRERAADLQYAWTEMRRWA